MGLRLEELHMVQKEMLKYERRKEKDRSRYQRFINKKFELGYSEIKSLWINLNSNDTQRLKEYLKNASKDQLRSVLALFENNKKTDPLKILEENPRLKQELLKYISLKKNNQKKETLKQLSLRLMSIGISTISKKDNKKIAFNTGSLSRFIQRLEN